MAKTRKEVIQVLIDQASAAVEESLLKEGYLWSRVQFWNEKGNEKKANEFKMKFQAMREQREGETQLFLDYLEGL